MTSIDTISGQLQLSDFQNNYHELSTTQRSIPTKSFWSRWLVVIGVGLSNLGGQLIQLTFAPVAYESAIFLNVSTNQITMIASIGFPVVFVTGLVSMWAIDKYGLYWPVVFGAWMQLFGTVVRCIGVYFVSYDTVLAGQILSYTEDSEMITKRFMIFRGGKRLKSSFRGEGKTLKRPKNDQNMRFSGANGGKLLREYLRSQIFFFFI